MRFSSIVCAGIVAACAVGPASAQTSVDRTFKASSQDCRDVQWSADILRDYPGIAGACQRVEQRDGRTFVKFQGTVKSVSKDGGELKIDFKDGETLTLAPTATTMLYMGGVETPVSQLYRGAKLNFYVPEDRLTAQFFADDSGAKSVEIPIVREQAAALEPSQAAQSEDRHDSGGPGITRDRRRAAASRLVRSADDIDRYRRNRVSHAARVAAGAPEAPDQ